MVTTANKEFADQISAIPQDLKYCVVARYDNKGNLPCYRVEQTDSIAKCFDFHTAMFAEQPSHIAIIIKE